MFHKSYRKLIDIASETENFLKGLKKVSCASSWICYIHPNEPAPSSRRAKTLWEKSKKRGLDSEPWYAGSTYKNVYANKTISRYKFAGYKISRFQKMYTSVHQSNLISFSCQQIKNHSHENVFILITNLFNKNKFFRKKNVTETGLKLLFTPNSLWIFQKKCILGHEASRSPTGSRGISESAWSMVSAFCANRNAFEYENDCSGAGFVIFRIHWVVEFAGQNFQ